MPSLNLRAAPLLNPRGMPPRRSGERAEPAAINGFMNSWRDNIIVAAISPDEAAKI